MVRAKREHSKIELITQERLKELLSYDPTSGHFTWEVSKVAKGKRAGSLTPDGYVQIRLDRRNYLAHRLVWLYAHGEWPKRLIDHINGGRSDNRISNLRDASRSMNAYNMHKVRNPSGLMGVSIHKKYGCRAYINLSGKTFYLGTFVTPEDAHAAYLKAKPIYHKDIFWHHFCEVQRDHMGTAAGEPCSWCGQVEVTE